MHLQCDLSPTYSVVFLIIPYRVALHYGKAPTSEHTGNYTPFLRGIVLRILKNKKNVSYQISVYNCTRYTTHGYTLTHTASIIMYART